MTDQHTDSADDAQDSAVPSFTPVPVRARHDGWTPETQTAFIEALAECGCVTEACARVKRSAHSAYALRRRIDAQGFRLAWDAALDYAIRRLSDAAFSRALHGVSRPVFYKGEQVGERRHYDEKLTMFLLRYRDPLRYGRWLDEMGYDGHPEGTAVALTRATSRMEEDAWADALGTPRTRRNRDPLPPAEEDFDADVS